MRLSRITRLAQVEAHDPVTRWQHTVGLSALLAYAGTLPTRDPWDMPELDTTTSMGKLLQEARARDEQRRSGL